MLKRELKKKVKIEVTVHGEKIQMLKFADNISLLKGSSTELGKILNNMGKYTK